MGTQQILISDDQEKDFQDYKKEKSDGGFVFMNIEDFSESNSTIKETNPISRIITRSFSRKVSQRKEEESKGGGDFLVGGEDDGGVGVTEEALKELAAALIGSCTSEKYDIIVNIEQSSSAQQQQQQKDMTKSIFHQGSNKFMRGMRRRSSYNSNNQFSSSIRDWIDPRRILFFFATLSSMGTIILIYFTLSIAKLSGDGSAHAQ